MPRSRTELVNTIDRWLRSDRIRRNEASTNRGYLRVAAIMKELRQEGELPRYAEDLLPMHIDTVMERAGRGRINTHYRSARTARPRQPHVLNQDRAILRSYARWLLTNQILSVDVASELENVKPVRQSRFDDLSLGPDEVPAILAAAERRHPRDRAFVGVGIYTGMRESELRELRVGDVSLEEGMADFVRDKARGNRLRMHLNADALDEIRRWLTWYAQFYGPLTHDMYLLPPRVRGAGRSGMRTADGSCGGYWPLAPGTKTSTFKRDITALLAAIGKPEAPGQGMHVLRRTFGRMMRAADADLREIQVALGHASVTQTEQYLCLDPEADRLAARYANPEFRLWGGRPPAGDNVVDLGSFRRRAG